MDFVISLRTQQYVQIGSNKSTTLPTIFGVPQGSILGPVLYVNDLQDAFLTKTIQYADDTTIYKSCKPAHISVSKSLMNDSLYELGKWAENNSLAANAMKTKYMICTTKSLSGLHKLDEHCSNIKLGSASIE